MKIDKSSRLLGCVALTALVIGVSAFGAPAEPARQRTRHLDYADTIGVELPAPPSDKALVVFMRPKFGGVHTSLYHGEEFIGFVHMDTCFIYEAEPDDHEFMVIAETANFMDAELEAGKIYFVRLKPKMGMWKPRFVFVPITRDTEDWQELPGWLENSYLVEPNQSAMDWYEGNKPSVDQKRAKGQKSGKRVVMASTGGTTSLDADGS